MSVRWTATLPRALTVALLTVFCACAPRPAPGSAGVDRAPALPDPAPVTPTTGEGSEASAAPSAAPAGGTPAPPPTRPPRPELVPPATAEELRAWHRVNNEGARCTLDGHCDSPLRCIDDVCAFPPAMTGQWSTSTPLAIFYPQDRPDVMVHLELALTPPQQQRGLMHRRYMREDAGMIFVFPTEEPRSFWMRNTLIPLDMVFVRSDGVVDSLVERAEPLTETSRRSAGPARFVIELNAGRAARIGIQPGDRVELLNLP